METVIKVENVTKRIKLRKNKNFITGIWNPQYDLIESVKNISFEVKKRIDSRFLGTK